MVFYFVYAILIVVNLNSFNKIFFVALIKMHTFEIHFNNILNNDNNIEYLSIIYYYYYYVFSIIIMRIAKEFYVYLCIIIIMHICQNC